MRIHLIISYYITSPAALLQAEKNLIHLDAEFSLLGHFFGGYLFSVWVVCVHFILFIKLFLSVYCLNLCRATFAVWITKRTSLASVLLLDKESDALHKINYYIYKDTEHKYWMLKHVLRAVDCLLLSRLWRQSQYISSMSEAQGGGLIRDRSRRTRLQLGVRASAVTVETQLQSGPFTPELHRFNV